MTGMMAVMPVTVMPVVRMRRLRNGAAKGACCNNYN
jgi:hypothetical protein